MIKERNCTDEKFRNCDSDPDTHCCKNCGYSFGEEIKEGQEYTGECRLCDIEQTVVCHGHGVSYNKETASHKGGENHPYGTCHKCIKESKAIDSLYEKFREGSYGYDDHYKNYSQQKMVSEREDALEKIATLPKETIKHFLRSIYDIVER